jgi:tetratricopeptide (TPR) repeat protein
VVSIFILLRNPKTRYRAAFYAVLSMIFVLNRAAFEIIGNLFGIRFKFINAETGSIVTVSLICLAAFCLFLDYLENKKNTPFLPSSKAEKDQQSNTIDNSNSTNTASNSGVVNANTVNFNSLPSNQEKKKLGKELTVDIIDKPMAEFLSRKVIIKKVRTQAEQKDKIILIHGIGGVGKTVILNNYMGNYYSKYDHIASISLEANLDTPSFRYNFVSNKNWSALFPSEIQNKITKAKTKDDYFNIFKDVIKFLREFKGANLLIIDDNGFNATNTNLRLLEPLLSKWNILFASRKSLPESGLHTSIFVDLFNASEVDELFNNKHQLSISKEEIDQLLEHINPHPLLMNLIAKILESAVNIKIKNLIPKIKNRNLDGVKIPIDASYKNVQDKELIQYINVLLESTPLKDKEIFLLRNLALMPLEWHSTARIRLLLQIPPTEVQEYLDSLVSLARYGFIEKNEDNFLPYPQYRLHSFIQELCIYKYHSLEPTKEKSIILFEYYSRYLNALNVIFFNTTKIIDLIEYLPQKAQQQDDFPIQNKEVLSILQNDSFITNLTQSRFLINSLQLQEATLSFLGHSIKYHRKWGNYEEALILSEKYIDAIEALKITSSKYINIAYKSIIRSLLEKPDLGKAAIYLNKYRNYTSSNFESPLSYLNLKYEFHKINGAYEDARICAENFLSYVEKLKLDHLLSVSQDQLATVLQNLGQYEKAKKLLEKALNSNEKNFGEDHPITAISYSKLGSVLQNLGQYEKAKKLLEKALNSDEKNFGEDHPATAISYSKLGSVLQDLGQYEKAKKLLKKALNSDEKNFGEDHPLTAIRYSNLGSVLQDLGEYEKAKKMLKKALHSTEKNLGEGHPNTAKIYARLGSLLKELGKKKEAKEYILKALEILRNFFHEEHPRIQKATKLLEDL